MEKTIWKTLAIISWVLFILLIVFICWGMYLNAQDEDKINECYYGICGNHADAEFINDICYCYEYDILGYLVINKTEYMG